MNNIPGWAKAGRMAGATAVGVAFGLRMALTGGPSAQQGSPAWI